MVTDELRTANLNTSLPWILYPNPAHEWLRLQWGNLTGEVSLQLIDALGRMCINDQITVAPYETIQIPVLHLPNGTYRLVMVHSNQVYQQQVQILHP
jgi:Secretion system C-terminal sorting domain